MRFEVETNIYNPSALSRKFSSIQTQFDVTLGKISAIISDSDIEQYTDGHTTMNTKLSATIQDLEGFHQTVSQMQTTYNGNFTSINSQLSTLEQTISGISASVSSVSQNAIKSDTIHYLATSFSSGVTRNTAGWTDTPQSITATNRYLWIYHTYTRGDNSTVNTDPVIAGVWGNTGNIGNTGVSVSSIVNYYLASASSSGVTRETSGWTTTIQNISQNYPYLWNYEIVYGDDNSVLNITDPVIIGRYGSNGANGRGISSVTEYYQKSSSNTTAPTTWSTSLVNTTTTDKYLWNYERITYTDGTTEDSTKRIIGVYGDTGARGDDGVSIASVTTLRYASSSSTAPNAPQSKVTSQSINAGNWTTAVPALSTTYPYMYTCDQIEWNDNTVTWTSVVRDNALTDLVSRVSAAELKITDSAIVSTVRSSTAYQNDLSSKNASYTGDYKPTASNDPASSWTTTALKESHINDTFLTSAGELYQYIYGCYGLMITFDDLSETETPSFDYVEIYYQIDGTTYVLPHLGGTAISGKNIFVPAPVFWLYWKSDSSVTKYGFKIKSIERGFNARPELVEGTLPSLTPTELSGTDFPETTHPYTNNEEKFWKYSTTYGSAATLTYGWSLRSDPNKTSASEVESIIEQKADSIRLKADKISWSSTYSSMTDAGQLTCTGGKIGGFTIGSSAIYNGITSVGATSGTGVYLGTDGINLGGGKFKVTSSGSTTVKSLSATDYIYVDGNSNSFFKLPLYPFDGNYWFKISNGGLEIVMKSLYRFESSLTNKTTMKFGSNSSSDKTPIEMTNSEDERAQITPSYISIENNYTGGTSTSTDYRTIIEGDLIYMINKKTGKYVRINPEYSTFIGNLSVQGTKSRIVSTDDYSDRLLYCYETPSPLFGDIGEGEIGEDGKCYVWIDPIFAETIRLSGYQVFLQSYSQSHPYVSERSSAFFVVCGEPGSMFGWEIKAKQDDFAEKRLDGFMLDSRNERVDIKGDDYGLLAKIYVNELREGRYVA